MSSFFRASPVRSRRNRPRRRQSRSPSAPGAHEGGPAEAVAGTDAISDRRGPGTAGRARGIATRLRAQSLDETGLGLASGGGGALWAAGRSPGSEAHNEISGGARRAAAFRVWRYAADHRAWGSRVLSVAGAAAWCAWQGCRGLRRDASGRGAVVRDWGPRIGPQLCASAETLACTACTLAAAAGTSTMIVNSRKDAT